MDDELERQRVNQRVVLECMSWERLIVLLEGLQVELLLRGVGCVQPFREVFERIERARRWDVGLRERGADRVLGRAAEVLLADERKRREAGTKDLLRPM